VASPMPVSRSPSPMSSREIRREVGGSTTQDILGQAVPVRHGPARPLPPRPLQDPEAASEQFSPAVSRLQSWQDGVGQSYEFRTHPPATQLQVEIKGLRRSLEKHHEHAVLAASEKQRIAQQTQQMQQGASGNVTELRAMVVSQQSEQAASLQLLKSEVDVLRKHLLTLCELEDAGSYLNSIDDLRRAVADHQEQSERAFQSAHSEIKILMHDMGNVKHELRSVQELVVSQKGNVDAEFKQLRHEVEGKFSQQELQVNALQIEVINTRDAAAQKNNSGLVDEVQQMFGRIEELRSHHGRLITTVESELKSFRHELQEMEMKSTSAAESKFAEFRGILQEQRKEAAGTWSKFQSELERLQKRQNEEFSDVVTRSNDLLMQTQSDMNSLRDLFDKRPAQQDSSLQQESLATIRSLQAEIEHLRRRHEDFEADLGKQDSSQAELREVRGALQQQQALQDQAALAQQIAKQAQRLEVEAVQQQLKELKARLDTLGSTSKSLQDQMGDLSDFTKQGLASMQQLATQPMLSATVSTAGHDGEVAALKTELDALKLQISMQRSLRDVEVEKRAGALHEQMHEAVGSEREARMQESIETRSLIKSLYEETARLAKQLKAERVDLPSTPAREPVAASTTSSGLGRPAYSSSTADRSIAHIDVTRFIGVAKPDSAAASRHSV